MLTRPCFVLRCEMLAEAKLADVFRVFENPYNLAKITPPWLNFQVVTPDVEMRRGALIDYTIRWMGLPMGWRTLISEYEAPRASVDEQLKGTYTVWRHLHTFEETARGTRIVDQVRYVLPLGPLGRAAHAVSVEQQLKGIFRFRQRALAPMLGNVIAMPDPTVERAQTTEFDAAIPRTGRAGTASQGSRTPAGSYSATR